MKKAAVSIAWRSGAAATAAAFIAGCAPAWLAPLGQEHPYVGHIADARTGLRISRDELLASAIASRLVILGEIHDNPDHHRLQAEVLAAMVRAGRSPALAMEQFDREHQAAIDAARVRGETDPERLADAGRFDRDGWRWLQYKPLIELAAANGLPILAANFSREDARRQMKAGGAAEGVAPATPALQSGLEQDIVEGHCGIRPSATLLSGMVEAQRTRDALMAQTLGRAGDGGAVLIAGAGHARRDRGVPAYLPRALQENLLTIAFIEVPADGTLPSVRNHAGIYDLVWFTPRAKREDPCRNFRLPQK